MCCHLSWCRGWPGLSWVVPSLDLLWERGQIVLELDSSRGSTGLDAQGGSPTWLAVDTRHLLWTQRMLPTREPARTFSMSFELLNGSWGTSNPRDRAHKVLGKLGAMPAASTALLLPFRIGQSAQRASAPTRLEEWRHRPPSGGGVSGPHYKRTRNIGEIVSAVFGECCPLHFLARFFSFSRPAFLPKGRALWDDSLCGATAQS